MIGFKNSEGESKEDLSSQIHNHETREVQMNEDMKGQESLIAKLRLAEERSAILAAIVDSSDDAIISKDLNGIITSWNRSAERLFGYTQDEMIGLSILKLIPTDRLQEEPEIIAKIKAGQRVKHFETKRLTNQGNLIDVSLTISPVINPAGKIVGISKIARDITDKKLEEQRKNDFIAIVSHELKTPLTSMRSYVQLALRKARDRADAFTISVLDRADNQTRKMTTMIQDFLNLSRLEEGKMSLNCTDFSLAEVMKEIVEDAITLAPSHHISYEPSITAFIKGDREKICQVLTNLIGNAVKYSPERSTVTIKCETEDDQVVFSISDQGYGIGPADQLRLFERFYRVRDDRQHHVAGFGIGLYLVAEILKLHGSEIEVQSELNQGSTFSFSLPIRSNQ
jgi:two-component system sensor histidine kinase VicK